MHVVFLSSYFYDDNRAAHMGFTDSSDHGMFFSLPGEETMGDWGIQTESYKLH